MIEKKLLILTAKTIKEADRILKMSADDFRKEFGSESAKVEMSKIERTQGLIGNLNFFITELMEQEQLQLKEQEV